MLTDKKITQIFNDAKLEIEKSGKKYLDYGHKNGLMIRLSIDKFGEPLGLWLYRYQLNKKRRTVSIGKYPLLDLAAAIKEQSKWVLDLKNNIDPIDKKQKKIEVTDKTVFIDESEAHIYAMEKADEAYSKALEFALQRVLNGT